MSTISPTLKAALDLKTTKLAWSGELQTDLGNNRRVRCLRDDVEFLNMASTGPLTIVAGNIAGLGVLSNVTVRQAADLATGSCVLRLEGNGHTLTYSLGLPGSGKEFILPKNPTGSPNEGYAFARGAGIKAPRLLASGTGPAAPPIKATTPTIIELVDWTNPNAPVVVGTATFSVAGRQDDWVFQHPEMAAEIGDVAIYQLDDTIKWTSPAPNQRFELGGLLLIAANYNSENSTVQLEQMLCSFKPYGRWASYPAMDTFTKTQRTLLGAYGWPQDGDPENRLRYSAPTNPDTADITYPPPFKINLKTADGAIVFTHEMKAFNDKPAGPINGPQYSQKLTATEPLIPHFNCGMMLPWQNIRTKRSANVGKYFPGVNAYAFTGDRAKSGPTSNPDSLLFNVGQISALNHFYVMPAYPLKNVKSSANGGTASDNAYLAAYESRPYDPAAFTSARDNYTGYRWTGYKYQPGSMSGQDTRWGVGGMRFDRSVVPTVLAIWATDPNWVRPEGNVPIIDMVEGWGMAYFNQSCHWLRDVKTFDHLPKQEIIRGEWVFANAYYGSGPYGALGQPRGPQQTIDLNGPYHDRYHWVIDLDPTDRLTWGGWQGDSLHSYSNPGWYAVLLNSPMHALAASHSFSTQWMSALGGAAADCDQTNGGNLSSYATMFMYREGAWRWFSYIMQWQLGTEHRLGYSQEEVAARFQVELESLYEQVYRPMKITNDQRVYFTVLRNLGIAATDHGTTLGSNGGSLALYYAHAMVLMRQFGLWKAISARSDKCAKMLDLMIELLDKSTIDYICDTDGRDAYYPTIAPKGTQNGLTSADIPANWAAQKVMLDTYYPVLDPSTPDEYDQGPRRFKNFTRRYNDRYGEQDGNPHMFRQYFQARKLYFPEYPHARLDAAIAKMAAYYTAHDQAQAANNAYNWAYYFPSHGEILAPTALTPLK